MTRRRPPLMLSLMQGAFYLGSPVMPKLMTELAYQLWIMPPRHRQADLEKSVEPQAKIKYFKKGNARIRVLHWGVAGPEVLFIHGWGGRGTQVAGFVPALIQAGYQVVSFDMPAHGQSSKKQTDAYEVKAVLSTLIEQLDDLKAVITHSFGGLIFSELYQPSLSIEKCILICPPSELETAFSQFSDTLKLSTNMRTRLRSRLKAQFGEDVFDQFSILKQAEKLQIPTLLIHDIDDDVVLISEADRIANEFANLKVEHTSGLGHRRVLEDEGVLKSVIAHLANDSSG